MSSESVACMVESAEYPGGLDGAVAESSKQRAFRRRYQKSLVSFARRCLYAGESVRYAGPQPFVFYEYRGRPCLTIDAIASEKVYNSLVLSQRQRTAVVLEAFAPRVAKSLLDSFQLPRDIGFFAVVVVYGYKDPTNDYAEPRGEAVTVIAKPEAWARFAKAKTTLQGFLKSAEVYCYATSTGGIKITPKFGE